MIGALVRRWLCRAGRHDVLRCAGAEDHRWTWRDGRGWVATLDRVPPATPTARAAVAADTAQTRVAAPRQQDLKPAPTRTAPRHRSTP